MAKGKGAGVSDELRLKVTHAPVVRITDLTQEQLRRLILEHIKGLPEMRGFKILTAREDDGVQFIGSITGKGEKSRGRQPELMIVHFEVTNPKKSQLVNSQEMGIRIEALWAAIKEMPQLESLELKVYDRVYWSDYDLEDNLSPHKFALTIEFYPEKQDKLEKKVVARGKKYAENRVKDALRKALRTPAVREEIKRCVK
ncbi:hypothetical protein ES703_81944 [subsurface metagenome]|nr:hypothetical protein [bacterium]